MTDPFLQFLDRPTREHYTLLVLAYMPAVDRLVRRLVKSDDLASDIVQETFLALGRKSVASGKVREPRSYILGIAFHLVRRHLREAAVRRRHEKKASRMRPRSYARSPDGLAAEENVFKLHRAIDSLPEPIRVAMHLHAIEGLSYREIAAVTGASVKAISMRVSRARKMLRQRFTANELSLALVQLRNLGPETRLPPPSAASRVAESLGLRCSLTPTRAGVPLSVAIVCVCAGVLGLVFATGRSNPSSSASEPSGALSSSTPSPRQLQVARDSTAPQRRRSRLHPLPPRNNVRGSTPATAAVDAPADTNIVPFQQEAKGSNMNTRASSLAPVLLALGMAAAAPAAETGDFDGDGRLSIADLIRMQDGNFDGPVNPAAGSFDAIADWCGGFAFLSGRVLVYLESLRRNVPGSFPHPIPVDPRWVDDRRQEALLEDGRVTVGFEPMTAPGGEDDEAILRIMLTVDEPVRAFSLILEATDGVLQVPFLFHEECGQPADPWNQRAWSQISHTFECHTHALGDIAVAVAPSASLVTAGRYVITRNGYPGMRGDPNSEILAPGAYTIQTQARLPRGTRAGKYKVRLLPGSEVLLDDAIPGETGTLFSPLALGDGEIVVATDVTGGFDGRVPPLRFDASTQSVQGNVELRVVNANGIVGSAENPVASGNPGEEIRLRVQLRTEVPLNDIHFRLRWPAWALQCSGLVSHELFVNREDGRPFAPFPRWEGAAPGTSTLCSEANGTGCNFRLAAAWSSLEGVVGGEPNPPTNYIERLFEYFRPLGEWLDVHEVGVVIPLDAKGGTDIPLEFQRYNPDRVFRFDGVGLGGPVGGRFMPYSNDWPCDSPRADWPESTLWHYDLQYADTFIHVLGANEPPPPPDYGIRFELTDVSGAPGDLVEVPVWAASETPIMFLRLVLECDPKVASVEAVDVAITSDATGEIVRIVAPRGGIGTLTECVDEDMDNLPDKLCTEGVPFYTLFPNAEERFARIDWLSFGPRTPHKQFLRPALQEIARLLVRIHADPPAGQSLLRPALMTIVENGFEVEAHSGGSAGASPAPIFFSDAEVTPAVITVTGFVEPRFLRGDSNHDGRVDLSDAVATLGSLFLGNASLPCLDAADVDDSGVIQITDPIFLLSALFLGTKTIPEPYPACGSDAVPDALGCREQCP